MTKLILHQNSLTAKRGESRAAIALQLLREKRAAILAKYDPSPPPAFPAVYKIPAAEEDQTPCFLQGDPFGGQPICPQCLAILARCACGGG